VKMARVVGAVLVLAQVCRTTCMHILARAMEIAQGLVILGRTRSRSPFHTYTCACTFACVTCMYAYLCSRTPRIHMCSEILRSALAALRAVV
jgi:hypothetical protein